MSKRDDYSAFLSPIHDHSYINTPYISPTRDYPYSIPADDIIQAFKDFQSKSKQLITDIEECKDINNKYKNKLDEYSADRKNTSIDNVNNYNNDMNIYTTDILNIETKNQTLLSKVTQLEQDNKEINDKVATNLLYQSQLETYVLDYNIKIKERERQTHLAALEQQTYVNKSNNDVNDNSTSLDYSIANGNSYIKESIYIHKHQLQHIHNEIYTQKSIIIDRISEIKQKENLIKHLNSLNTELLSSLTRQQLLSLDYQTRMTDLTINRFNFVPAKPSPRTKPYTTTASKLHSRPALGTTTSSSSSIVYSTSKPPVYSTKPTTILPTRTTGTSRRKSTSYTVHRLDNTPATHTHINTVHTSYTNNDGMYSSSQELCDRTELLTANQWAQYTSMRDKMRVKLATVVSDTSTLQHHPTPTSLVSQSKPVVYKSTRQNVPIEKYIDNTTSNITSNQTKKTKISKKKKSKSTTSSIVTTTTTRVPSSVFPSSTLPTHLTSNLTAPAPTTTSTPYTAPFHLFTDTNSGSSHLPRGASTGASQDRGGWPPDYAVDYSNNSARTSNRVYNTGVYTDVYSDSNAHVSSTDYSYTKLSDEQLKAYHNILSQPPIGQNYDPYHPVRLYDSDQGDRFIPTPDSHTYTAENDDDDRTGSNNDVDERDVSIHIIYDPTIATSLYDIEEPAAVSVVPVCTVLTPVFLPTSVDPDPTKEFNLIAQQSMASPSNAGRHSSRGGGGGLSQTPPKSLSRQAV